MAQDPWKRAHQLTQLKQTGRQPSRPEPPAARRRRLSCGWSISLMLLALLVLASAALWLTRGWWVPRYREALPAPVSEVVAEAVGEPEAVVDLHALETGLGIELVIGGDYLDLLRATNDWDVPWHSTVTGSDTLRLKAPGIIVYIAAGKIQTYEIELPALLGDECWAEWRAALGRSGLSENLTWTALSGESEMPPGHEERFYASNLRVNLPLGEVRPVFVLHFYEGWLKRVEGRVRFESAGDEPAAAPPGS